MIENFPGLTATPGATEHTLPDGRVVACTNADHAEIVWHEVGDGLYLTDVGDLREGATVLDVGAHIGLTSLFVADQVPGARIIACEPAVTTFTCLERNFTTHLPGCVAVNKAVAAAPGTAEFTYYSADETMATLEVDEQDDRDNIDAVLRNLGVDEEKRAAYIARYDASAERYPVPVTTVGELIAEYALETVDLLKIDVERAELAVLQGIGEDDWPKLQHLAVEVHDMDGRLAEVKALLRGKGFTVRSSQQDAFRGSSVHIVLARRS